ncbi:Protein of uncharacterised function (DUF3071) [Dermatophilus congolensis]|uniref:Protein of uncharacterized function (DUF3071) n=1 Tax=Dermatophilus congolensis TaxID=1863 RepID=A0AA46BNE2_9MICO|nr:septation protein SepH [Dermatophilus congolensis]STD09502.1 Protein of uncharacterised function (DUF3071) [Dermatophilus congolensis]
MRDLYLIGVHESGEYVLLGSHDSDIRYRLTLDDAFREAARWERRHVAHEEPKQIMRPAEVQALIRAGYTTAETAERAGWTEEKVRRFEGPILAERDHVAGLARRAHIRGHSFGQAVELRELVDTYLRERHIDTSATHWDSYRTDDGQWVVEITFVADTQAHLARWRFSRGTMTVSALNAQAAAITNEESPGADHFARSAPLIPRSEEDAGAEHGDCELVADLRERIYARNRRRLKGAEELPAPTPVAAIAPPEEPAEETAGTTSPAEEVLEAVVVESNVSVEQDAQPQELTEVAEEAAPHAAEEPPAAPEPVAEEQEADSAADAQAVTEPSAEEATASEEESAAEPVAEGNSEEPPAEVSDATPEEDTAAQAPEPVSDEADSEPADVPEAPVAEAEQETPVVEEPAEASVAEVEDSQAQAAQEPAPETEPDPEPTSEAEAVSEPESAEDPAVQADLAPESDDAPQPEGEVTPEPEPAPAPKDAAESEAESDSDKATQEPDSAESAVGEAASEPAPTTRRKRTAPRKTTSPRKTTTRKTSGTRKTSSTKTAGAKTSKPKASAAKSTAKEPADSAVEQAAEASTPSRTKSKSSRGRASVPSWDDIMFGARPGGN